jgi:uncharacterized protein (TIGR03086 family)
MPDTPDLRAIADRYRRVAAGFTQRVEAVPADAWDRQSPCPDWTARDVIGHIAGSSAMFLGFVGRPAPEAADAADDPLGAWTAARDAIQAALDDPAVAATEYDGLMGRTTLAESTDRFLTADLVLHGWDIAVATGGDTSIDQAEASRILGELGGVPDEMLRSPGAFGPRVEVPDDADDADKLLGLAGRDPAAG